jgi:dienelactone hydrolase
MFWPVGDSVAAGEERGFPTGEVIPSVTAAQAPDQTYALYLPSQYTPERRWPIIIAFDPAARGRLPVERFREAAEEYGYIVVGSNNSRNGPLEPIYAAAEAMWDDSQRRFSVDPARIYMTGFSGGSRAAWRLATETKAVAGVIGCGAGPFPEMDPTGSLPFAYCGVIGRLDMNFLEMRDLDVALGKLGLAHRLLIFEGGHEWPPARSLVEAVEWMELQAMRSGRAPKRDQFVESLVERESSRARDLESAGRPLDAYEAYERLARDLEGLVPAEAVREQADRLGSSEAVRKALESRARLERQQESRLNLLRERFWKIRNRPFDPKNEMNELRWWRSETRPVLAVLDRPADHDPDELLTARRVYDYLWRTSMEHAAVHFRSRDYGKVALVIEIGLLVRPGDPTALYNLACARAQTGRTRKALDALEAAVAAGFGNLAHIGQDTDLDPIRDEPRFEKIVGGLAGSARERNE